MRSLTTKVKALEGRTSAPLVPILVERDMHDVQLFAQHHLGEIRSSNSDDERLSRHEQASDDYCVSSAAAAELSAMVWKVTTDQQGHPSFIGPGSSFSFPIYLPRHPINNFVALAHHEGNDLRAILKYVQDAGLVSHLGDCFLRYINPYYQFIDQATYTLPRVFTHESPSTQCFYISILAAGACYSHRTEVKEIGVILAHHVQQYVLYCYRQQPNSLLARALSILAWRELSIGNDTASWMYLSTNLQPFSHVR